MDLKKLIELIKKDGNSNKFSNLIVICLIGILLVIAASFFKNSNSIASVTNKNEKVSNTAEEKNMTTTEYENEQEVKLKALLQSIQGIGNVQVMINFSNDSDEVAAYNENSTSSVINEVDNSGGKRTTVQNSQSNSVVLATNGENTGPVIISTNKPKINGVMIVAEGAEQSNIKLDIITSVAELFDISEDRVNVLPMKNN